MALSQGSYDEGAVGEALGAGRMDRAGDLATWSDGFVLQPSGGGDRAENSYNMITMFITYLMCSISGLSLP